MTLPKLPCYLTTTKGRTNLTRLNWRPEHGHAVVVEDSKEPVTEMPIKDWHLFLSHWNSNATDFFFFFRLVIDDTNTIWMERIERILIYWFWFCSPRVNPDVLAKLKYGPCARTPLDGKEWAVMAHLILPHTDMKPANYTHTLWYSNLKALRRPACSLDIDLAL